MRSVLVTMIVLLLCQQPPVSIAQQSAQASIDGIVLRSDNSEPVAAAQVTLLPANQVGDNILNSAPVINSTGQTLVGTRSISATTDQRGRFSLKNLAPGTYRLAAVANGYASQEYGQRIPNSPGIPIVLIKDQILQDAIIRLIPTGVIAGKVLEESGRPATGAPIRIFRRLFTASGEGYQQIGATSVDDRGEYRLFGVTPGRYYLSVGDEPGTQSSPIKLTPANPRSLTDYAYRIYPGVNAVNQAVSLEVRPGTELTVNMLAVPKVTYRVRGQVLDSTTGRPPSNVTFSLAYMPVSGSSRSYNAERSYDPATGMFELRNISPGSYIIQAQSTVLDAAARAAGETAWAVLPAARFEVLISDRDREDVNLTLSRPSALSGRVSIESKTMMPNGRLYLSLVDGGPGRNPPAVDIGNDGEFQIIGLVEGSYNLSLQAHPKDLYVKSIQFDGVDVLNQPLRFAGPSSGRIEVVMRPGVAHLSGSVTDERLQLVSGAQIILLPEKRGRMDLYRLTLSDQYGRFTFSNLPPGAYKLFSFEAIEQNAQYDPEFIKRFEQQGKRIQIAESSSEIVDMRVISIH